MFCPICCDECEEAGITCSYCQFETCYNCCGTYILSKITEPCCMKCTKTWSREFVMSQYDGKWVRKTFLPHMGKVLMEQEKLLLPDAQHEASLVSKIKSLSAEVSNLPTNDKIIRKYKNKPELEDILNDKRETRIKLSKQIDELKKQSILYGNNIKEVTKKVNKTYIFKCPFENCRGFVSLEYECGTCCKKICDKCHLEMEDNHKCKKEDIKTASMILKETKPCPKCMTLIFKASGCNQMFCTQCQTTFDWVSGKIDNGMVHNPHFYEYLAAGGGMDVNLNVDNMACGDFSNPYVFSAAIRTSDYKEYVYLLGMHRSAQHVRHEVLPRYQENKIKDNIDLRVSFLRNEFDEDVWAMKLINRDKKRMKIKAIRDLLVMVTTVMDDFIRHAAFKTTTYKKILEQYDHLKKYYDDRLEEIICVHGGRASSDLLIFEVV